MKNIINEIKSERSPMTNSSVTEPFITLISDKEATVEGCKGIVEYSDVFVSVNCKKHILKFEGFNLTIKSLSKDCISVAGTITQLNFCVV